MKKNNGNQGRRLPRRQFFRTLMQGMIGSSLAITGGYLLMKEDNEEPCTLDFTCSLCKKTAGCSLPAARSYREYEQRKKEGIQ